jgi:hypothetical protein
MYDMMYRYLSMEGEEFCFEGLLKATKFYVVK